MRTKEMARQLRMMGDYSAVPELAADRLEDQTAALTTAKSTIADLQKQVERLRKALCNARDFMEHEYLNSWDCCTPPRTPVSMEPRDHKNLIDPYSFDDMVRVADLIRATDAALSGQEPSTQDTAPADHGLKEQVRPYDEAMSVADVLREEFFPAKDTVEPRVKRLEWDASDTNGRREWLAKTGFGEFRVRRVPILNGRSAYSYFLPEWKRGAPCNSEDDGFEHCQAHFESLVSQCLTEGDG